METIEKIKQSAEFKLLNEIIEAEIEFIRPCSLNKNDSDALKIEKLQQELKFLELEYYEEKNLQVSKRACHGNSLKKTMKKEDFKIFERDFKQKRAFIQKSIEKIKFNHV